MVQKTDAPLEPKWLTLARGQLGTHEIPGTASNPTIEDYYAEAIGHKLRDEVPWCAAFVGAMLRRAGLKPSGSLWARSYLNWGLPLAKPIPGAITILSRGGPSTGHVGFFIAQENSHIQILGGNQSDAVTIASYPRSRLLGYRWPIGAKEKSYGKQT